MIALDTNVVVRFLVNDEVTQAEAARALIDTLSLEEPGFICRESIIEIVWVLERSYRFSREAIVHSLAIFLTSDSVVVEEGDDVLSACRMYEDGDADFADLMILQAAGRRGAIPLYTFDRRLSRLPTAALVAKHLG